jgi:hypothetical protein
MPFFTPRGLKNRLDPDAIHQMVDASDVTLDLNDAFADVELWADLPGAMCAVGAMGAAICTHSVAWTLTTSVIAFAVGNVFQQFAYSVFLRILFPQFLGAWLIAAPASIAITVYLYSFGFPAAAFTQLAIVAIAIFGFAHLLLIPLTPVRVFLRRARIAPPIGDVELAFIAILNRQASSHGQLLDWTIYVQQREANLETPHKP